MVLDPVADFIELTVQYGYDAAQTQIDVVPTDIHLPLLPDPDTDGEFNLLWFDDTNFNGRPQDDPNREWVRVTAISSNHLIVTRGQEGTSASTKSTAGATYKLILAIGAKFRNDIEANTLDVGVAYSWITEYGGVGDGIGLDQNAVIAAIADGVTHLVIPEGTWRFYSTYEIPDTLTIQPLRNAMLTPDTGVTLTISGPIIAGNWQIFAGAGTVVVSGARQTEQYSRWWGTAANTVMYQTTQNETVLDIDKTGASSGTVVDIVNAGSGPAISITQSGDASPIAIGGTYGNHIVIGTAKTPASATATGTTGMICWDSGNLYVCTATDTWKKVTIATW